MGSISPEVLCFGFPDFSPEHRMRNHSVNILKCMYLYALNVESN